MEPESNVAAVVLAAGRSSRIGEPKALLRMGGRSFVGRIVRTLASAGAHPILVVAAPDTAAAIGAAAPEAQLAVNAQPQRGQLSSLQTGLSALPPTIAAVLFMPVDLPLVRRDTVAALIAEWRRAPAAVVRPVRAGRHGHPVLVDRRVMDALLAAGHDQTTRGIIRHCAGGITDVPVDDEGAFMDVDTREDYARALEGSEVEDPIL